MTRKKEEKILIVGAGCFGISTAYHLLTRGFSDVTVLDRSNVLPAPDAASCDINKIVRSAYHDVFYARLARDAISLWKNNSEWGNAYHESGVVVLGADTVYAKTALLNEINLGARVKTLDDIDMVKDAFPSGVHIGHIFDQERCYFNKDGGWAAASEGIAYAMSKVKDLGGKVIPGIQIKGLTKVDGVTTGVHCEDGKTIAADLVIIATGAWTASTFPELSLGRRCLAAGQSVVTIQLDEDEAERYRACPVVLDFTTGFYIFPPTRESVVKMARHIGGYVNLIHNEDAKEAISTPRTVHSHGAGGLLVPKADVKVLRECLQNIYPALAKKPFSSTRMCWYTDSPDSDWIIDVHPTDPSLVIATSGSGHGYKFLPVLGKLVVDRIENTMELELQKKFAINRPLGHIDLSREGRQVQTLNVDGLCTAEDLLP
ncbi:FAD dependent oxidoreductase [Rickenella mellea]|uniref:FAD dependent oxidoreductase n=1 Tax=Rickenella mellea TaxID=50990 RepID=A0A4Y7Q810_9AGAM|nr:FAD dependent oxidoreductase [Rickenella mellea]